MLRLSGLYRFPLKSAVGECLSQATLDALGLVGDRRWMIVDAVSGRFLTQRLLPQLTQLKAEWQGTQALRLRLQASRLARQPMEALRTARLLAKHQAFSKVAAQGLLRSEAQIAQMLARAVSLGARRL